MNSIGVMPMLAASVKNRPHEQHIWFLPTQKPTLEKPKELYNPTAS